MVGHLLNRLLGTLGVLFGMSILIFAAVHILPGNVAYAILGEYATPAAVAQLEQQLGLHDPLWLQYWRWLRDMLHGDFGQSLSMSRPAFPVIVDALGRSALLAGIAFLIVAVLGIALGVHAATHRGQASDRVATLMQLVFIAIPDFFWGILCVVVFWAAATCWRRGRAATAARACCGGTLCRTRCCRRSPSWRSILAS